MIEIVLKDRFLNKGDECEYYSVIVNGTGATWCKCIITEIIDKELKIYKLTDIDNKQIEWIVQDIDEKIMMDKIGKEERVSLSWIKI